MITVRCRSIRPSLTLEDTAFELFSMFKDHPDGFIEYESQGEQKVTVKKCLDDLSRLSETLTELVSKFRI